MKGGEQILFTGLILITGLALGFLFGQMQIAEEKSFYANDKLYICEAIK